MHCITLLQAPAHSSSTASSEALITLVTAWLLSHWCSAAVAVAGASLLCITAVLRLRLVVAKSARITASTTITTIGAATTAAGGKTNTLRGGVAAVSVNNMQIDIASMDSASDSTAVASVSHTLLCDVMIVLVEQRAVPQELWCVSKGVNLLVRDIMPITVNIAAGTSAAAMQSLFDRESVKHVHIDGDNIQPDVIAAIAATLHLEEAEWRAVHEPHTLWRSSSVESFTLANFQQWHNDSVVQRLLEQTPHSVHTLRVMLQHADDDYYYQFGCPHSVKTLVLHNCAWTVEFNAGGQLAALHMEGVLRFSIDLTATLRTVVFRDVVTDGVAMLPELPNGVTSLDLSESGIVHPNDIPRMPTTLTDIRWPNGYVQPAAVPQHAQWHGVQGN
jgi:hypothetical protein